MVDNIYGARTSEGYQHSIHVMTPVTDVLMALMPTDPSDALQGSLYGHCDGRR